MKRIFKPGAKVKASSGYAGVNLDAAQIDVDQNDQTIKLFNYLTKAPAVGTHGYNSITDYVLLIGTNKSGTIFRCWGLKKNVSLI